MSYYFFMIAKIIGSEVIDETWKLFSNTFSHELGISSIRMATTSSFTIFSIQGTRLIDEVKRATFIQNMADNQNVLSFFSRSNSEPTSTMAASIEFESEELASSFFLEVDKVLKLWSLMPGVYSNDLFHNGKRVDLIVDFYGDVPRPMKKKLENLILNASSAAGIFENI